MAEVRIEHVAKRFGNVVAVNDVTLTIRDGEFMTLLGPSGCGKTTTLRLIAGLEKASAGQIYFDRESVGHLPANRRDIAMVFQSYAVYPHMNVYDNISFALRNMKVPAGEIQKRVTAVVSMLDIAHLLERMPKELSGGQRQRVALGRAIVRNAPVFLLDEPLSNLDAKLRLAMRGEIKKLHAELGKTFVYVTHDQAEALTMSDNIAVMDEGRLRQVGTPDDVYDRPADTFVAAFIGSPPMNLIEGRLVQVEGVPFFQWQGVRYRLSGAQLQRLRQCGDAVILGVRPESVLVLPPEDEAEMRAAVYIREPLGADLFLTLDMGGQRLKARTTPGGSCALADSVAVRLDESKMCFFDPATGTAVSAGQ